MKPIPAPKIERRLAEPTELFCVRVPVKQSIRARLHRLALLARAEGEAKTTASDLARAMLLEKVTSMEMDWLKKIRDDLGFATKDGQISYHVPESQWGSCSFAEERQPEFDGHTSEQVLERLEKMASKNADVIKSLEQHFAEQKATGFAKVWVP